MAGYNRGNFNNQMMGMGPGGGNPSPQIGMMYNQNSIQNAGQQQNPNQNNPSIQSNQNVQGSAVSANSIIPQPIMQQQRSQPSSTSMLATAATAITLTRYGQETIQDITSRFQEIFAALKTIQPTGNRENSTEKKVQEYFRTIRLLFKRLRIIYDKCNDGCSPGMEYTHVESLIPYKDEPDHKPSESTQCEEYKKAVNENRELIQTVMLRNTQLREIIERTRIIISEINTMLSMRRS